MPFFSNDYSGLLTASVLFMISFAIIVIIFIIVFSIKYKNKENYVPYASILAPEILNSTAGFDFPDQYGETTDPYECTKKKSENNLLNQTHQLYFKYKDYYNN